MQHYKLLGWNLDELTKWGRLDFPTEYPINFPQIVFATGESDISGFDIVTVIYNQPCGYYKNTKNDYSITWFNYEKI